MFKNEFFNFKMKNVFLHLWWSVDGTYLISASLLVIGIGIGAFGNSSRWTRAVRVTFGSQHLSLQQHH